MKNDTKKIEDLSFDAQDEVLDPRPDDTDFDRLLDTIISRRSLLKQAVVFGSVATLAGKLSSQPVAAAPHRFAFSSVDANSDDDVTLPPGYSVQTVVRWGDPLWSEGSEFDAKTRGTAASQAQAFGDNVDGMEVIAHEGRTLLVANNEYTNRKIIWGNRAQASFESDDDIHKGMLAHGVTVVEIAQSDQGWHIVKDSMYNRRITPQTPMQLTGPAAGYDLLKTASDPEGTESLGTWNNCGNGKTPWGTYLACEENFNGYFSSSDETVELTPAMKRYGLSTADRGYGWSRIDERFDLSRHPNECNRNGYVVEIDPRRPDAKPKKRTALGRFKHENAEMVINRDGRVVVYMGDDERGEFLYRYVSDGVYAPGADTDDLLEKGRLYVAKFFEAGRAEWIELSPAATGMASVAEICVHTRMAASLVGATTMDRPEWVAANPHAHEVYVALTNNKNRGIKPNSGGDATPVGGPNPRKKNRYGQILRWRVSSGDHTANEFEWDLFVLAGNPSVYSDDRAGSANINVGNMFNSPDGLKFDTTGLLWIQTDGKYSNKGHFAGQGNNQMLVADPVTGEIRRFLVGPNECEVTGLSWSPDKRTLFVGIQHPGEKGNSHWPAGGNSVPRSAVIAITRDDGEAIV